eukprot:TRINITY_DN7905_c0_g1_i4.p1 TRINITY_DN7905_c0_g1~~TRINITY_DN7905_c0_g1_i4.p1  ORF type:complete len:399 (+),score=62.67 TRINITY_DN7905_c0_g1_i4:102-1199(+)
MKATFLVDSFADKKLAESFICCICQEVPTGDNVIDHGKCGGIFCFDCISLWLQKNPKCPKCNNILEAIRYSKDNNRILYNLLQSLKITCPNTSFSCSWVGVLSELGGHLEEDRKKNAVAACPYKVVGCTATGTEDAISQHLLVAAKEHASAFQEYSAQKIKELEEGEEQNEVVEADKEKSWMPGMLSGTPLLSRMGNPVVFLDICIENVCQGRLVFHLFANVVPKTVDNFKQLCTGSFTQPGGKTLSYRGSFIHRIIPDFLFQGGDIVSYDGRGSASIYGERFPDENFSLKHQNDGVLSMANNGPDSNGSQFFVTLSPCPWLDGRNVVFGEVIEGLNFMKRVERFGSQTGAPTARIYIANCGQLY